MSSRNNVSRFCFLNAIEICCKKHLHLHPGNLKLEPSPVTQYFKYICRSAWTYFSVIWICQFSVRFALKYKTLNKSMTGKQGGASSFWGNNVMTSEQFVKRLSLTIFLHEFEDYTFCSLCVTWKRLCAMSLSN